MRVALLKGQSMYGLLRVFIDDVAAGFVARGWDTLVFDFENADVDEISRRLTACGQLDLIFSINAFGAFQDGQGRSVSDLTGAPHVLHYVDHPFHWLERFHAMPPSLALLLVDHSHVRTVATLCGEDRFAYLGFCAHGGMGTPVTLPETAASWIQERPIEIFFPASNYRHKDEMWGAVPELVRNVFRQAVEQSLATEWIPSLDALDDAFIAAGMNPRDPSLPVDLQGELRKIRMLSSMVHEQVRCERRQRFITAACKVGLPLTVAGNGWEGVAGPIDNKGFVATEDILVLMRQSRLCINTSVNFGEGSHERPLTAMLAGAATASDATRFYEDTFSPQDIALFHWMTLEEDLAELADLMRDHEALFALAQRGHKAACQGHRWADRIDTYIEAGRVVSRKLQLKSALAAA